MKILFKITFKKVIPDKFLENILEAFEANLQHSAYKEIKRDGENKLIVTGKYSSFRPKNNIPGNLWYGFSQGAEIYVADNNIAYYSLDYTVGIITSICSGIALFVLIPLIFQLSLSWSYLFYFIPIFFTVDLLYLAIRILSHRSLFVNTVKYGKGYIGRLDWDRIIKEKSLNELKTIANNGIIVRSEVREMAKKEIEQRKKK